MPEMMMEVRNLRKVYNSGSEGVEALKGVSFSVNQGESLSIMGQSGSGKSTLLTILGALNHPTAGQVRIDGIDLYQLSTERLADFRREYLGFVFQQFQLIPYLTAIENVMLPLAPTQYPRTKRRELALRALDRVGLSDKARRLPNQLSGGEQERVAIARAVVNEPPLVLADEPTGSLDTRTGEEIMNLFRELHGEGITLVMVTHNPENARTLDRILELRDGEILRDTGVVGG